MTGVNDPQFGLPDAYTPAVIAERIETVGVTKANLPFGKLVMLGILAGAFIALGAAWFTVTMTGNPAGFGPGRLLGGVVFSLGLILVIIGGAELFTGNNLIVMAWADRKVTSLQLLRNWAVVYVANFAGALAIAALIFLTGILGFSEGAVEATTTRIAVTKSSLPFDQAFFRGLACNILVCLAIWISMAARTVAGKVVALVFPISAFVALGFEHSVANMYFIPLAMMIGADITIGALVSNLVPVTLGNIVGGGGAVALVYWVIYGRQNTPQESRDVEN